MATQALRYPYQRIDGNSDYLQIRVLAYKAPGLGNTDSLFEIPSSANGGKGTDIPLGSIILPIPEGLTDMNGVTWESDSINALDAGIFKSAESIVDNTKVRDEVKAGNIFSAAGSFLEGGVKAATNFGKQVVNNQQAMDAIKTKLTADAANIVGANVDANSIISRTTGQILNPNLELLFKGVQLRTFQFGFKLTPRNSRESAEVKAIINTFKRRMAAKKGSSNGIFINSPDVFELKFKTGNQDHPFLFKMKKCALKNMNVSYMDTGLYATYEDATPVAMTLNLTFQELSPVYNEDYNEVNTGVGF